jgi:hypothetical protein
MISGGAFEQHEETANHPGAVVLKVRREILEAFDQMR